MVQLGDSRKADTFNDVPKARFVVTSPPYFGMRTYLPDQWLGSGFLVAPTTSITDSLRASLSTRAPITLLPRWAVFGRTWLRTPRRGRA